jgi:hypothetical protein
LGVHYKRLVKRVGQQQTLSVQLQLQLNSLQRATMQQYQHLRPALHTAAAVLAVAAAVAAVMLAVVDPSGYSCSESDPVPESGSALTRLPAPALRAKALVLAIAAAAAAAPAVVVGVYAAMADSISAISCVRS